MEDATVSRRRKLALVLTAVAFVGGGLWAVEDAFLLAGVVCAAGLIWSSRQWKVWPLAAVLLLPGLWLSRLDERGCSAWWRGKVVYEKAAGHLPYFGWKAMQRQLLGPCDEIRLPGATAASRVVKLEEKVVEGQPWELYQTDLGKFWLPAPGENLIMWLVWEIAIQKDYENHDTRIFAGDTVIDCGAHVGVFTKYALQQGAAQVVAIEPDPTNLACLEANLASEIANGVVSVVKGGVWDRRTRLNLFAFDQNSAAFTFLGDSATFLEGIPVFPLDDIVEQLELSRVGFIKMDIEGSEQRALRGGRQTITRFRPRMAICAYHVPDDPTVIPAIVRQMQPTYRIHAKDVDFGRRSIVTKVLFFH